jgi:hypothetical protein
MWIGTRRRFVSVTFACRNVGRIRVAACLTEVNRQLGLNLSWEEVAHATNRVYVDRSKRYVCRVHGGGPDLVKPAYTVEVALYLARCGFCSNRLAAGLEQPIRLGSYLATVWEYASDNGVEAPLAEIGVLLRDLHSLNSTTDSFKPKQWEIPEVVRQRLDLLQDSQITRGRYWNLLRAWLDRSRAVLDSTSEVLTVIHGDFKRSNVAYAGGRYTLLDLDSTCLGPPAYDRWRIEIDIHAKRIDSRLAREFAEAYQYDLPARAASESFARIARLGHTTLFELRLAEGADVQRRCMSYESWWQSGADLGEIAGWMPA